MASLLPQVFRKSTDNLNFSVDYFDYASGAGYKSYYPAGANVSAANVYFLTPSTSGESGAGTTGARYLAASGATASRAFLLTFNNPATIAAADCFAFATLDKDASNAQFNIEIIKVAADGTGTSIGREFLKERGGAAGYYREALVIPLSQTSLGVGDKLKVVLEMRAVGTSNIYHDPASRQTFTEAGTSATIGSDFELQIPFKIDL